MNDWYDDIGRGYNNLRAPDPRIAGQIRQALRDVKTLVNVGAGTGAYEPDVNLVVSVEPSQLMLGEYRGSGPCLRGVAESLPFKDAAVDGTLAVLTLHHWSDWQQGLKEMLRVSRSVCVILTHGPDLKDFWLLDYFPEIQAIDQQIFSPIEQIEAAVTALGWHPETAVVEVPCDCSDGFLGAYWRRPEAYLHAEVRRSISTFNLLDSGQTETKLEQLRADLACGVWDARYGAHRSLQSIDLGYRMMRLTPH